MARARAGAGRVSEPGGPDRPPATTPRPARSPSCRCRAARVPARRRPRRGARRRRARGSPTATSSSSRPRCSPRWRAGWCPRPTDPEERDALRRELVDAETERVRRPPRPHADRRRQARHRAGRGRRRRLQRARPTSWRCCPPTRTPAPPGCAPSCARLLGVDVAVVVTDTMGRAGGSGRPTSRSARPGSTVLHRYARHGRRRGQRAARHRDRGGRRAGRRRPTWSRASSAALPVAVVRGLAPVDDGSTARDLVRPLDEDLFRLGTDEAIAAGPPGGGAAAPQHPRLRRRAGRPRPRCAARSASR